jgi:hypothetical protein
MTYLSHNSAVFVFYILARAKLCEVLAGSVAMCTHIMRMLPGLHFACASHVLPPAGRSARLR